MHSYRVKQLTVEKQGLAHVIIAASKVVRANVSVNLPKHHMSEKMLDSIAGCIAVVTTALQSCCNRVAIAYSLQMTCVHLSMASKATSEQDLLLISQRSATCIMFFQRQNNLASRKLWAARLCTAMAADLVWCGCPPYGQCPTYREQRTECSSLKDEILETRLFNYSEI